MVTPELMVQTLTIVPSVVLALLGLVVALALQEDHPKIAPLVVVAEAVNLVTCVAWFVFQVWASRVWGASSWSSHSAVMAGALLVVQVLSLVWPVLLAYAALEGRVRADLDE